MEIIKLKQWINLFQIENARKLATKLTSSRKLKNNSYTKGLYSLFKAASMCHYVLWPLVQICDLHIC